VLIFPKKKAAKLGYHLGYQLAPKLGTLGV